MPIFDPVARGYAADFTNGCQMISCSHVEKYLNGVNT